METRISPVKRAPNTHETVRFQDTWDKAARLERQGKHMAAKKVWTRALRHAKRIRSTRAMKVAIAGLEAKPFTKLGPATTPTLSKRPRSGRADQVLLRTSGGAYPLDRKQVEGFLRTVDCDIVVDRVRQQVRINGTVIGMEGRDIPVNILATLIERGGGPISMGEMFEKAWGRRFNAAFDANTVYFHVCRLRKILDEVTGGKSILAKVSDGYQLKPGLRFGLIEHAEKPKAERGHDNLIDLIRQRGFITNRTYCEITKTSRSTALRELADLVKKGVLVRCGSGRGAHYRLAADAAVAA